MTHLDEHVLVFAELVAQPLALHHGGRVVVDLLDVVQAARGPSGGAGMSGCSWGSPGRSPLPPPAGPRLPSLGDANGPVVDLLCESPPAAAAAGPAPAPGAGARQQGKRPHRTGQHAGSRHQEIRSATKHQKNPPWSMHFPVEELGALSARGNKGGPLRDRSSPTLRAIAYSACRDYNVWLSESGLCRTFATAGRPSSR